MYEFNDESQSVDARIKSSFSNNNKTITNDFKSFNKNSNQLYKPASISFYNDIISEIQRTRFRNRRTLSIHMDNEKQLKFSTSTKKHNRTRSMLSPKSKSEVQSKRPIKSAKNIVSNHCNDILQKTICHKNSKLVNDLLNSNELKTEIKEYIFKKLNSDFPSKHGKKVCYENKKLFTKIDSKTKAVQVKVATKSETVNMNPSDLLNYYLYTLSNFINYIVTNELMNYVIYELLDEVLKNLKNFNYDNNGSIKLQGDCDEDCQQTAKPYFVNLMNDNLDDLNAEKYKDSRNSITTDLEEEIESELSYSFANKISLSENGEGSYDLINGGLNIPFVKMPDNPKNLFCDSNMKFINIPTSLRRRPSLVRQSPMEDSSINDVSESSITIDKFDKFTSLKLIEDYQRKIIIFPKIIIIALNLRQPIKSTKVIARIDSKIKKLKPIFLKSENPLISIKCSSEVYNEVFDYSGKKEFLKNNLSADELSDTSSINYDRLDKLSPPTMHFNQSQCDFEQCLNIKNYIKKANVNLTRKINAKVVAEKDHNIFTEIYRNEILSIFNKDSNFVCSHKQTLAFSIEMSLFMLCAKEYVLPIFNVCTEQLLDNTVDMPKAKFVVNYDYIEIFQNNEIYGLQESKYQNRKEHDHNKQLSPATIEPLKKAVSPIIDNVSYPNRCGLKGLFKILFQPWICE